MNRHTSFNSGNSQRNLQNGSGTGADGNNNSADALRGDRLGSSVGLYDAPDGHGQQVRVLTYVSVYVYMRMCVQK
jgi:hypothetical protein